MKVSRSMPYCAKFVMWPFRLSLSSRLDRPCPRQSSVATAKPRALSSRTTSKYFSMNSVRPWKMHTVPFLPAGGGQRANLNVAPSGVLNTPVTAPSGTGFAGIETSVTVEAGGERVSAPGSGAPENSAGQRRPGIRNADKAERISPSMDVSSIARSRPPSSRRTVGAAILSALGQNNGFDTRRKSAAWRGELSWDDLSYSREYPEACR